MLYYLAKRFHLKRLRNLFCKIGWHSDIDGYSMHLSCIGGKMYRSCPWCGRDLSVNLKGVIVDK